MFTLEIQLVIFLIVLLLSILLCLLCYLIINKIRYNRFRSKVELFKENVRDSMFLYLYRNDDSKSPVVTNKFEQKGMEELLNDFSSVVASEEMRHRIQSYAEEQFTHIYKKDLYHRRWSIRMNVLYNIEDFHMTSLSETLLHFYESRTLTVAEESQILKTLASFTHPNLVNYVKEPKQILSEFVYRSLFASMGEEQFEEFIEVYDQLPFHLQLPLIDIIGIERKLHYIPFLEKHVGSGNEEVRIRMLKALAEVSYSLSLERLVVHAHSPVWQERMMTAKLIGKTKNEQAMDILSVLLHDQHFSVRSNAAQALLLIPSGKDFLLHLSKTTNDKYARDMAKQWLEKGGVIVVE